MLVTQNWPYAVIAFSATAICSGLALYAWRRRAIVGAREFAVLMIAIAWMGLTGAVETMISAHTLDAKIFVTKLYLIGGTSAPLLALLFTARYTGRERWLTPLIHTVLWRLVGLEILLAFTNDWHYLYWTGFGVTSTEPSALVLFDHGVLNHLLAFVTYGLMATAIGLLVVNALYAQAIYRRQSLIVLLAMLVP